MIMRLSAVLWDFDGTLVDTETPTFEAWREIYRHYGLALDLDLWRLTIGTSGGFDPWRHLMEKTHEISEEQHLREWVARQVRERCARQLLRPGVSERLEETRALGLPTAVVSSSGSKWVENWLDLYGIRGRFFAVFCKEHVDRVKPDPDLYELAAERLKVDPKECLAFEDSPNGLQAARNAGVRCVVVPNPLTRGLAFPEADLVLESLAELTLKELMDHLGFAPTGRSVDPAPEEGSPRLEPGRTSLHQRWTTNPVYAA
jgi:HAD superfamily hydrolase (TIGR01509 family)